MASKIFEEAIADAKKLKEVAEQNAKKTILEAVTPRIREFIEDQLLEDDENDVDEEDLEEDVVLDESSLKSLVDMLGGVDAFDSVDKSSEMVNSSISEAYNNLNKSEKEKLYNLRIEYKLSASRSPKKQFYSIYTMIVQF